MKNPGKILIYDIEWKPTTALVWRAYDENIGPDQILEHGGLLCVGAKWHGEEETHLFSEWDKGGHQQMVENFYKLYCEADAVVTYNGDKYDNRKVLGEFLLAGLAPPPPVSSIDCLKSVKKFGLFMNRLAFVGPFFNLGSKLENEGILLWKKVMAGDPDAQARMAAYCTQDVVLLEELYDFIRPYIYNHPFMGEGKSDSCGTCGSTHRQKRGIYRTRCFVAQRYQCQGCGQWTTGTRTKVQ